MQVRINAVIPVKAGTDLTGSEGKFVKMVDGAAVPVTVATDAPLGVVLEPSTSESPEVSVAVPGGFSGTLHMKAGGAIAAGSRLFLKADGSVVAAASGLCVGVAVESAQQDELFEAVMSTPATISA